MLKSIRRLRRLNPRTLTSNFVADSDHFAGVFHVVVAQFADVNQAFALGADANESAKRSPDV
jgi:hypothetical protein